MDNICKNCKYFVQHYIKKDIRYHPIGGHCINAAATASRKRKIINYCESCNLWESDLTKREEREENIKLKLVEMQENLKQIAQILQDKDL